jgi:ABC-type transport system substrate-binding protein
LKHILIVTVAICFLTQCKNKKDSGLTPVSGISFRIEDEKAMHSDWSKENTVIVHSISDPDNLHPTNGNSAPRSEIILLTQRTILYTDYENQTMIAGLVKAPPVTSEDGLSYIYELKSGPKWDDNTPLTFEDILFTAKAYLCPLVNNPAVKTYWRNMKNIIQHETNPNIFQVLMRSKNIQNQFWFGSFPVLQRKYHDPENVLANYSLDQFNDTSFRAEKEKQLKDWAMEFNSDKYGRDPQHLNGLGMYKVERWESGQFITLDKKEESLDRRIKRLS